MPRVKKTKSKRSSMRDRVKKHAKESRKGNRLLDIPSGVDVWYPEEKGNIELDIIPYIVTDKNHPDEVEVNELWYRRPYYIHFIDKKPVVCPRSVGKKCPICEEVDRLRKDYDANKEIISGLKAREQCLFNFVDPTDKKQTVKVFDWSSYKFAADLEKELDESDDPNDCAFADLEGGSTVRARISEDSFAGSKFLKTSRLDFRFPRRDYDEEILDKVVDLDTCFKVKTYDELVTLLCGAPDDDEDEEETPVKKSRKPKAKPEPEPEPEDEEDEEDDDDDWDDNEEEEEKPEPKPKKRKKKPEPEPEEEDDEDWDDDEDDSEEEDDDWDDEDDAEDDDSEVEDDPEEDDDDWDDDEDDSEEEDEEGPLSKEEVKVMKKEELVEYLSDGEYKIKKSLTALKRMPVGDLRKLLAKQL